MRERDLLKAIGEYVVAEGSGKEAARAQVAEILGQCDFEARARVDLEDLTRQVLREVGMPCKGKQYDVIVCAVAMVAGDESLARGVGKRLYPRVAGKIQSTPNGVERCVRAAIEATFDRSPPDVIERYFGNSIDWGRGKATNVEFITRMAEVVRKRHDGR